jgi:small-conductance mechanosensitive channel
MVGYHPADIMNQANGTPFSGYAASTTHTLTSVMILHPIATALCFIAFLMALGSGMIGSLLAALVSTVAFLVTVVALIVDFVLFSIVKSNVNDQNNGAYAYYSIAMWTILVAAICSLIGTVVVFLTCCSGRLHKRRAQRTKVDTYASPPATTTRRRWYSRY